MQITPIASNMTELELSNYVRILFSYKTPVAVYDGKGNYYRTEKKWSVTTSKHINKWLCGAVAEPKPQEYFNNITQGI
jgi:hypothetical protein